jgi:hypothetical protein
VEHRKATLNWNLLNMSTLGEHHLDVPFSEGEIKRDVDGLPSENVPDPDGFIGTFYRACGGIIKHDVVAAF